MDTSIKEAAMRLLENNTDAATLHMLAEYGPLMTIKDVSKALGLSVGTVRNGLSSERSDMQWVTVLRKAKRPLSTKSPRFLTTEIARMINHEGGVG